MTYQSYDEIFNQADSWRKTFDHVKTVSADVLERIKQFSPGRIIITACGSSYWGALSGGRILQRETGLHTDIVTSGDLFLNYKDIAGKSERVLIITPSRTGKTRESVMAVKKMKERCECLILNIGCTEESPLKDLADVSILIPWAHETSICQTRSFTNLYISQVLLAAMWSGNRDISVQLNAAISEGSEFISRYEEIANDIASMKGWRDGFVLANGGLFGIGCEGALILQEMSQTPIDFYTAFEYRHGPVVLTSGKSTVVLLQTGRGKEYEKEAVRESKARGAWVMVIGEQKDLFEYNGADCYIGLLKDGRDDFVNGVLYIAFLQMLAYYKAIANGKNPDQPAGLVQWIDIKKA